MYKFLLGALMLPPLFLSPESVRAQTGIGGRESTRTLRAPRRRRAERLLQAGRRYLEAGDPGSASGYFRDAIADSPRWAPPYTALGELHLSRRRWQRAEEVFAAGLVHSPVEAQLMLGRARSLRALERAHEAATILGVLLLRQPDNRSALELAAEIARAHARWTRALNLERALLGRADLTPSERLEHEERVIALRLLAAPSDALSARRSCGLGPIRQILARCPASPGAP